MASTRQLNFSAGELAPSLYARTDQVKYATGLRQCRNCMVRKEGGATNRPGLEFIAEVKDSDLAVRLIKFVFNDDETYVIELGDRYARFIRNRGQVTVSGVSAWVTATAYTVGDIRSNGGVNYYATTAHTSAAGTEPGTGASWQTVWYALTGAIYEIPTPYLEADLPALQYVQSGDVITIVHPSYAPRELRRYDHTDWTLTPIAFGPAASAPTGLALSGGAAGAILYWAVTAVDAASLEESLAGTISATNRIPSSGTPTVVTWTPVTGALEYNVYRSTDGVTYGWIGKTGGAGIQATDTVWTDTNEVASTGTAGAWATAAGQVRNPLVLTPMKSIDGKYRIYGRVTLAVAGGTTSYALGQVRAYYQRNTDASRQLAGVLGTSFLSLTGSGTNGPVAFIGTMNVPDDGYTGITIDLVPEVFFPDILSGAPTASMTLDVTAAPSDKVEWLTSVGSFSDTNQTPEFDVIPPVHPSVFAATEDYPSETAYYQQRRLFASTTSEPEKIWGSRTASHKNFSTSTPLQDDDAVSFTLVGEHVNVVRHLVDFGKKLLAFTSGGEWIIDGDEAGILRPTAINATEYTSHGAKENLAPLKIGRTVLYVQARGSLVRDFFKDLAEEFTGGDLTVYAAHLFEGHELVDWDYQETPHSIVWAVREDGVMLGLTYIRKHAIEGWHRHDTEGLFENVCVIPEGTEDAVYVVVRRTIDGASVRYIEAMKSRYFTDDEDAFFVDSGLTYDGWNTTATTVLLGSGVNWTTAETLTLAASAGVFVAGDVGKTFLIGDPAGDFVRFTVMSFNAVDEVEGNSDRTVPVSLRNTTTTTWARAESTVTGLDHLEGEEVSVLGDGFVEASALRDASPLVVTGGEVDLSKSYAVIHVGLPYIADLETLDIDTASGPSTKAKGRHLITNVGVVVEKTRGAFAGPYVPTGDDPVEDLDEFKERDEQTDPDLPPSLITDYRDVSVKSREWGHNGRVLVRQVDPLPMTVLSIMPGGYLGSAR